MSEIFGRSYSYKFLSGTELFMKSHSTPLLVLPLACLIENTTNYIWENSQQLQAISSHINLFRQQFINTCNKTPCQPCLVQILGNGS